MAEHVSGAYPMTLLSLVFGLVAVVALALVAGIIWRRPQSGLLVLAALTPLNGLTALFPAVPAWWKEAVLAFSLLAAFIAPRRWARRALHVPWWPAAVGLAAFGSVSAMWAFGLSGWLAIKITFCYAAIVVVLWRAPFSARDRDTLVTIVMGLGIANAVLGIVQQVVGTAFLVDLGYSYGQQVRTAGSMLRSFGTFNQPFPYALFLMTTILIGLSVALADPWRRRNRVFLWCLPVLFVGMAFSVVRASYLGLAVGLIFLGIVRYRRLLYVLAAAALAAIPVLLVALPRSTITTVFSPSSFATRAQGWSVTWNSIIEHPLGVGLGSSGSAAEKLVSGSVQLPQHLRVRIDGAMAYAFGLPYQPDNYYVKLLVELGPIGLWLFVVFLLCVIVTSAQTSRNALRAEDSGLAAGIGAVAAAAAAASVVSTYFEIFPLDVYFWLLVGALACVPRSIERRGRRVRWDDEATNDGPSRTGVVRA